jgi:hypothetical protein
MQSTNTPNAALEPTTWATDLTAEDRPGVPRETSPHPLAGAHWITPPEQPLRPLLPRQTPVFSTALPPSGLTGLVRMKAYRIPDHFLRHWALLLFADRMEALDNLVAWITKSKTFQREEAR